MITTQGSGVLKLYLDKQLAIISLEKHLQRLEGSEDQKQFYLNRRINPEKSFIHLGMLFHSGTYNIMAYFCRLLVHGGIHSGATRFTRWKYGNSRTSTGGVIRNLVSTLLTQIIFYPFDNENSQYNFCRRYINDQPNLKSRTQQLTLSGFFLFPIENYGRTFTYFFTYNLLSPYLKTHISTDSLSKNVSVALLSSFAVAFSAVIWYPLGTIRRGIVMQEVDQDFTNCPYPPPVSMWNFTQKLYKKKGLIGFYDGFQLYAMLNIAPSIAPTWLTLLLKMAT